jgi:hypothetical protein
LQVSGEIPGITQTNRTPKEEDGAHGRGIPNGG